MVLIIAVLFPVGRVVNNVLPDSIQFWFIADHTVVESGLPGEIGVDVFSDVPCARGFE